MAGSTKKNVESKSIQWSAVRVTTVTDTVGYSDSFGNPQFITKKTPLLTVTNKSAMAL